MNELFAQLEFLEKLLHVRDHDARIWLIVAETARLEALIEQHENQIRVDFGDGMEA
jgi:hypothetical protein